MLSELAPVWPFRLVVAGTSGGGKTNVILDMISRWVRPWSTLSVYAGHLDSEAYQALRAQVEKRKKKLGRPISVWGDDLQNVIPVDDMNKD